MTTKLTVYNLSVTLETDDYTLQSEIGGFLDRYYTLRQRGFGPNGAPTVKLYAGKIKNKGVYQLHSSQFVHLYHYLKENGRGLHIDEKIDERDYKAPLVDMKVREGWVLREAQVPLDEFLMTNPTKSKLVPISMGGGKTFVSMNAIGKLKKRLAVVILARFIDKWVSDIAQIHEAKAEDILVIKGSKHLSALIHMAKEGEFAYKYVVFSAETLQMYITAYENDPESCVDSYGCSPIELFPLLGIGVMLNDETHMGWHNIFRIIIYSNVEYQIGLSATLVAEEDVIRRAHRVIYPSSCIYGDSMISKHIDVFAISYGMREEVRRLIKTSNYGSTHYSHTAYEQSILKRADLTHLYFKMIRSCAEDYYITDYKDKDKLIVFVATVQMATKLVKHFQEHYPGKIVNRYCEEDPYENLMTADIIVTTVISAGTGVDIPNLRTGIQTVSISSTASNLQSYGRLRHLPDRDTKFCYLYCNNLNKQKQYHMKRVELFTPRSKSVNYRASRVNF